MEREKTFRDKVLSSFFWLGTGNFAAQILSWLSTVIVIRLLNPSDYGLMAMASVLIALFTMISDMGIGAALVQSREIDQYKIRQVYGFVLLTTLAAVVSTNFVAPLIADFFGEGRLTVIIEFLSVNLLLIGLYLIPQSMLVRNMDFQTKAKVDVVAQLGASVTTLLLAYKGYGVWALAGGIVALHALKAIGFNLAYGAFLIPSFRIKGAEDLLKYGTIIVGDRIFYYLYEESDKIIIGRFLGNTLLGVYSVAMTLSSMVMLKILPIVTQVTFTAYSRIQDDVERIRRNILGTTHAASLLVFPLFWGMSAVAPEAIPLILGSKWTSAVIPFQLFCLIMPLKTLSYLITPAVLAIGKPRVNLVNMFITFSLMSASFLFGVWAGGLMGVVVAWVTVYPIVFLIITIRSLRAIGLSLVRYLSEISFPLMTSAVMFLLIYTAKAALTSSIPRMPLLFITILAGILFYLSFVMFFRRDEYYKIKAILQK